MSQRPAGAVCIMAAAAQPTAASRYMPSSSSRSSLLCLGRAAGRAPTQASRPQPASRQPSAHHPCRPAGAAAPGQLGYSVTRASDSTPGPNDRRRRRSPPPHSVTRQLPLLPAAPMLAAAALTGSWQTHSCTATVQQSRHHFAALIKTAPCRPVVGRGAAPGPAAASSAGQPGATAQVRGVVPVLHLSDMATCLLNAQPTETAPCA